MDTYPYEVRLREAPYNFEWSAREPVDCQTRHTPVYSEEFYRHEDGTVVVIRHYPADGSFHILSDRGHIHVIDHAQDPSSPHTISVVRLP